MVNKFIRRSIRKPLFAQEKKKSYLGIALALIFCLGVFFWVWKPSISSLPPIKPGSGQTAQSAQLDESKFKEFGIEISRIGIMAPVTANVNGDNKTEYSRSLKKGLAHYKGTGLPGGGGNVFIFGHSSSDTDNGPFSKIFAKLPEVKVGDKITAYYKAKKFEYRVSEKKIVAADDLSPLNLTKTEQLTLMTCWPVGTKNKRLIVIAR